MASRSFALFKTLEASDAASRTAPHGTSHARRIFPPAALGGHYYDRTAITELLASNSNSVLSTDVGPAPAERLTCTAMWCLLTCSGRLERAPAADPVHVLVPQSGRTLPTSPVLDLPGHGDRVTLDGVRAWCQDTRLHTATTDCTDSPEASSHEQHTTPHTNEYCWRVTSTILSSPPSIYP